MNKENKYQEELNLKDLILKVQELWSVLWKNKIKIIVVSVIGAILSLFSIMGTQKSYTAELSFMLNDDERSNLGIGAMLGQFGLNAVSTESNYEKILELSKTRKIVQNAIFDKHLINNTEDYLANHIINNQDSLGLWQKKKWYSFSKANPKLDISDFRFQTDSTQLFTNKDRKAIKSVHKILVGAENVSALVNSKFDEASGIMRMETITTDDELSVTIAIRLFETLSKYYIDKTIEKQKFTFDIIKDKADSIYAELSAAEFQLASFKDANRGLFNSKDQLREARLMREIQKLNIMYTEAAKNRELAEFSLQNKMPYIQIIDEPILPIKGNKKSKIKYLILGALLGGFLSSAFYLFKQIYTDIMK